MSAVGPLQQRRGNSMKPRQSSFQWLLLHDDIVDFMELTPRPQRNHEASLRR